MPGGAGSAAGVAGAPPAGGTCNVATYFWGGLVKLQVLGCPPDTELVFYGPQALLVEAAVEPAAAHEPASDGCEEPDFACSSSDGEDEAGGAAAAGGLSEEPHGFGAASVMRRGGLRPAKELRLKCVGGDGVRRPVADVAVSGEAGATSVRTRKAVQPPLPACPSLCKPARLATTSSACPGESWQSAPCRHESRPRPSRCRHPGMDCGLCQRQPRRLR